MKEKKKKPLLSSPGCLYPLPHLHSSLDARLNNCACALNVDPLKQPTVIAGGGWRGTVEDQGHVLQSWQQSLKQNVPHISQQLLTNASEEQLVQARQICFFFKTSYWHFCFVFNP